ncbi:hypothetical protein NPX13_g2656 [Xylaria arbuscula]|uniref:Zn(2)-C6 fungal-type domain-containing protein n=1 Tax=Xylaria arbuscula TaxID=114810 RepID=A0A9W8NK23_9PEZI|nr:hypothetical protein NPX13_g2656 [Xylaria arbuscula]
MNGFTGVSVASPRTVHCARCVPLSAEPDLAATRVAIEKIREPRRPNATACEACKDKKLKCVDVGHDTCERCSVKGLQCRRRCIPGPGGTRREPLSPASLTAPIAVSPSSTHPANSQTTASDQDCPSSMPNRPDPAKPGDSAQNNTGPSWGQPPTGTELETLIQLYFSSVHNFGFFAFIHQLHFNRLLEKGKAPRELTLIMIASAMRFAADPTPENLARADAWADAAIGALLSRIYQGFGAVQLMALLLAQNYDLNRGNFTSAWLLGSNCTRMMQMMSLQTFDRTYSPKSIAEMRLSPLLSPEALRRVAWSAFFIDTIVDGGRYGFHIVDESSFRLQLPCDQATFLSGESCVTGPLFSDQMGSSNAVGFEHGDRNLDVSAYLLRTAAVRRRALHFAFRASHKDQTRDQSLLELSVLEAEIEHVISSLPRRLHFNAHNVLLHRERLITFIFLHILRHNLYIVLGRAALLIYQQDPADPAFQNAISQMRRKRILHALPIAGLVSEGLKAQISFDPQIGVHAYVALEILLFEPRRLIDVDPLIDPGAANFREAMSQLLIVIRAIAKRSEFVRQLYVEAIYRLLQCEYSYLLSQEDLATFSSERQQFGEDAAEYDFRDFRWARRERQRRAVVNTPLAGDETLLELKADGEVTAPSAIPSPRLDAMDVNAALTQPPPVPMRPPLLPESLSFSGQGSILTTPQNSWLRPHGTQDANDLFTLDWASRMLGGAGSFEFENGDFFESIGLDAPI